MADLWPRFTLIGHRLSYANSFWLYPWMLDRNNEHLIASTPALHGYHFVDQFHGQSSPELPTKKLSDLDEPLFNALLLCWKRHYLGKRQSWKDRALFRSLNMAAHASQLPAGIDTTLYDLGRIAALWVSAFEILAHPRNSRSSLSTVYPLLERVSYLSPKVAKRSYAAYMTGKKPWSRRPLTCWLYGKLYQARCDFLHGGPVSHKTLNPADLEDSLFWVAPGLYRMALTGFLGLSFKSRTPKPRDQQKAAQHTYSQIRFSQHQQTIERALLRARK